MALIEPDYTNVVFQHFPAFDAVRSNRSFGPLRAQDSGSVQCYQGSHIVPRIVAERLYQATKVCFIDVTQGAVWIHKLIHTPVHLSGRDDQGSRR